MITLKQICNELKLDQREARERLRAADAKTIDGFLCQTFFHADIMTSQDPRVRVSSGEVGGSLSRDDARCV